MSVQGTLSAAERSIRSVFVGNIPYEATEEQLKDIFAEVGPVVSFRLVYDRETGKPKGYGFCEYKDQETALSAMRNLNGYELNGRALRVDNAASEKNKEELKNLQASLGGPPQESPYGTECDPDKAPEAISKAVASLPPEQMFELMKQMKLCIQNNPSEARNMLLQNPQLAYALLQAQVVMRIVDPQVAMTMLHRPNTTPSLAPDQSAPPPPPAVTVAPTISQVMTAPTPTPPSFADSNYGPVTAVPIAANVPVPSVPQAVSSAHPVRPLLGDRMPMEAVRQPHPGPPPGPPAPMPGQFGDMGRDFDMRDVRGMDPRAMDPRAMDPRNMGDRDMRMPPGGPRIDPRGDPRGDSRNDMRSDPRGLDPHADPRALDPRADPREMGQIRDPRMPPAPDSDPRSGPASGPGGPFGDPRFGRGGPEMHTGPRGDARGGPMSGDMRGGPMSGDMRGGSMGGDMRGGPMGGDMRGGPMGGDMRGGQMGDSRGGPMGDPRGGPMGDGRGGPMSDQRGGPMSDQRGGPMSDQRGGPMSDQRGGPMSDQRGGPMSDQRGGPMSDQRGGPMSDQRGGPMSDQRGGPMSDQRGGPMSDPRGGQMGDQRGGQMGDPRGGPMSDPRGGPMGDPRGGMPGFDQRQGPLFDQRSPMYDQRDPRMVPGPQGSNPPGSVARPQMPTPAAPRSAAAPAPQTASPSLSGVGSLSNALRSASGPQSQISSQDQEKAALIMQVLQLSDQQIAMLPPEQRQSIMVLKDQIARSTQQQQQQ